MPTDLFEQPHLLIETGKRGDYTDVTVYYVNPATGERVPIEAIASVEYLIEVGDVNCARVVFSPARIVERAEP